MADTGVSEVPPTATSKSKKNKKKRSKAQTAKSNGDTTKSNGTDDAQANESDAPDDEPETPVDGPAEDNQALDTPIDRAVNGSSTSDAKHDVNSQDQSERDRALDFDPDDRLEVAAKERDALRAEVTELRKSLESIQQRHEEEIANLNQQLEETQSGKEHAEGRYHKLLDQVNTIKAKLGERVKADAAELSNTRGRIEELERENNQINEDKSTLQSQISDLTTTNQQQEQDLSSFRERMNLSQQNWAKERDDLIVKEAQLREEFEDAKQAMQDWEVLAREERSQREALGDRVAELEDQLATQRQSYEQAASERENQSATVDGLQIALQDIQDARRQELREVVENTQAQIQELRKQLKDAEESAATANTILETTKQELERALPFEKQVKEKNLLIGKLRHEAVILNDYLTKALRSLKKSKPDDTIDRQLITNHFLRFLALDRSDPKKFQVLQLISATLDWTDEQNETAGLSRPGGSGPAPAANSALNSSASSSTLRLPLSPFRRTSSSTSLAPASPSLSLNNIFTPPSNPSTFDLNRTESGSGTISPGPASGTRNESLKELLGDFLQQEGIESNADLQGQGSVPPRDGSISPVASGMTSPGILGAAPSSDPSRR